MLPQPYEAPARLSSRHNDQRLSSASPIETLSEYFKVIETSAMGRPWYFRGENRKYDTPNLPKFSRDYVSIGGAPPEKDPATLELLIEPQRCQGGKYVYPSCMTKQEIEIIQNFKRSPPAGDEYFNNLGGKDDESAAWWSFAQHYGEPTRLLDVTADPLVALYFACADGATSDGYVWLFPDPLAAHDETPTYREVFDIGTGESAIADRDAFKQGKLDTYSPPMERQPLKNQFLLHIPEPNKRVIAQRGAFMWSPIPLMDLSQNAFNIPISGKAKPYLLSRLSVFGITEKGLKLS